MLILLSTFLSLLAEGTEVRPCCLGNAFCATTTFAECDVIAGGWWTGPGNTCADANGNGRPDACEPILGQKVYWWEPQNGLLRANVDGSNVETIASADPTLDLVTKLLIAPAHTKVYWGSAEPKSIARTNIDGSDCPRTLFPTPRISQPHAVDSQADRLYWSMFNGAGAYILRASQYDLSDEDDFNGSIQNPTRLALDLWHGKMYWSEFSANRVRRANLDGSGAEDLIDDTTEPFALVLVDNAELYWSDANGIHRMPIAPSATPKPVLATTQPPVALAIDAQRNVMYWIQPGVGGILAVYRAELDGAFPQQLFELPALALQAEIQVSGEEPLPQICAFSDVDFDGDLDLRDFATAINCMTGP